MTFHIASFTVLNLSHDRSSVMASDELKFFDSVKWAVTSNQILGFLPFSVDNGTLRFQWISVPVLLSFLQIVHFAGWPVYSVLTGNTKESLVLVGMITQTEIFAYALYSKQAQHEINLTTQLIN